MNEGEIASRLGLAGITPAAEVMMVERDLHLVEITGGRYHAAHLSTAAAIDAIRRAKARGLPVTCDTAPPQFPPNRDARRQLRPLTQVLPPARGTNGPPPRRPRPARSPHGSHPQRNDPHRTGNT